MRANPPRLRRHKKILKMARGYRMTKHRLYRVAREAVIHAGQYAFAGRRLRRRDLRRLWIVRINAVLDQLGIRYSDFIAALKKSQIQLDRKILSELATHHPQVFSAVVKTTGLTKK